MGDYLQQLLTREWRRISPVAGLPFASWDVGSGVPDRVGPYEILGELGRGGTAVVYRARRPGGPVRALKVLLGEHAEEGSATLERFAAEHETLLKLDRPELPRADEYGQVEGRAARVPYLSMELVEGRSVAAHCLGDVAWRTLRGAADPAGSVSQPAIGGLPGAPDPENGRGPAPGYQRSVGMIGLRLLSLLAALHRAGVLHRDLKPENILVRSDGQVRVLDLGASVIVPIDPLHSSRFTLRHSVRLVGTPAYLPPEGALHPAYLVPRSDVYSLAVVLFLLFTGRLPFRDTGVYRSPADALADHLGTPPRRPGELVSPFPDALEAWLLSALAKDWRRRPSAVRGGADLAAALGLEDEWRSLVTEVEATYLEVPAPFIGVESSASAVASAMLEATCGRGHLVLIAGPPGSGKTRLAHEAQHASRGRAVAQIGAWSVLKGKARLPLLKLACPVASPTAVLACVVSQIVAQIEDESRIERLLAPAASALAVLPDFAPASARADRPQAMDPDAVLGLTVALLERFAEEGTPCRPVWITEDIHLADDWTRTLLARSSRELRGRYLMVWTYRSGAVDPVCLAAAPGSDVTQLELSWLGRAETAQLLEAVLGQRPWRALVEVVHQESRGNASEIVGELLPALLAAGQLVRGVDGQWRFAAREPADPAQAAPGPLRGRRG